MLLCLFVLAVSPAAAIACLWDYDTIQMERSRFPDALELITGKFLRHSKEFYEWRIRDRVARLQSDRNNLALLDDLGVAYSKTGRHDEAIETARTAERLQPDRYETEANLGSFLIHSGRLKEGLPHIDAALRINPDAHFGREKYQKLLVEYMLETAMSPSNSGPIAENKASFAAFLTDQQPDKVLIREERTAAIKGVLGMMRFGSHESPVLLDALASLLSGGYRDPQGDQDAKQLAARAYLKASYAAASEALRQSFRTKAEKVLEMQTGPDNPHEQLPLDVVEASFREELRQAADWYEALHRQEVKWIEEGNNPDEEFTTFYADEPRVVAAGDDVPEFLRYRWGYTFYLAALAAAVLAIGVAALIIVIRSTRYAGALLLVVLKKRLTSPRHE
jgi:tetratricopeptide (TPR) repeat protein